MLILKSRIIKAPDKSVLPVLKKKDQDIQSYCCIDMRKNTGKWNRFGYYIPKLSSTHILYYTL